MSTAVHMRPHSIISQISPYGLSKPHTGTAAVLVDELNAGGF